MIILCLMAGNGAHLAAVQAVAWGTMLWERAGSLGFLRAVEQTFDGEHPCTMCERVQEASPKPEIPSDRAVLSTVELRAVL